MQQTIKYLTQEQFQAIITETKKANKLRDTLIFTLAFEFGLRASEVGLLTVGSYLPNNKLGNSKVRGTLTVQGLKKGTQAIYPLKRETKELLDKWLKRLPESYKANTSNPLLPSTRRLPVSRARLHTMMRYYGTLAGLPKSLQHFHVLRHTCAVSMRDKGIAIEDVKDWLRHRNIASTQVYFTASEFVINRTASKFYDEPEKKVREKIEW